MSINVYSLKIHADFTGYDPAQFALRQLAKNGLGSLGGCVDPCDGSLPIDIW